MAKQTPEWEPSNWDELFPGRFLKASHLMGKTVEVFIERIYATTIDDKSAAIARISPVKGIAQQDWGLNKTNGLLLKALFGVEMRDWRERRVFLHEARVEHGREKGKPCLRVCGSPDIDKPLEVVIDFHTKRIPPFVLVIRPMGKTAPAPAQSQPQRSTRETELQIMLESCTTQQSATEAWEQAKSDHTAMLLTDQELGRLKAQYAHTFKALAQ